MKRSKKILDLILKTKALDVIDVLPEPFQLFARTQSSSFAAGLMTHRWCLKSRSPTQWLSPQQIATGSPRFEWSCSKDSTNAALSSTPTLEGVRHHLCIKTARHLFDCTRVCVLIVQSCLLYGENC